MHVCVYEDVVHVFKYCSYKKVQKSVLEEMLEETLQLFETFQNQLIKVLVETFKKMLTFFYVCNMLAYM